MINIALCGVGNIGKVHLRNLLSLRGCRVASAFDINRAALEQVAQDFSVRAIASWQEILEDPAIDAVVIATPASSHREFCCSALVGWQACFC